LYPYLITHHQQILGLEHNRLCAELRVANPQLTEEALFIQARKWYYDLKQRTAQWLNKDRTTIKSDIRLSAG
jgi:hypothetical protein